MTFRFGLLIFLLLVCGITGAIWALTRQRRAAGSRRGLPGIVPAAIGWRCWC